MNLPPKKMTPVQLIVITYFIAVLISSILLALPWSHQPGMELSYLDALFTAASAISVTGLTVVNTAETFSPVGIALLMVMMQLGGLGFMTLSTFLWMATGQRIGISRRQMIMVDQNQPELAGLVRLARDILLLSLAIEAAGAVFLSFHFRHFYYDSWTEALVYGAFSSLSAFTNAGFDIFGNSLVSFAGDYYVQTVHILLLITGGIGFPVLIELKEWATSGNRRQYRFSLFTKITVTTYFTLWLLGIIVLLMLEHHRFYAGMSWHEQFFFSVFNSATTRSGGLTTMDISQYSVPAQLFLSFLMFVGASPSSVGGGIRTTTLAVVILAIIAFARGYHHVRIFRRELLPEDVQKAAVVFATGVLLVCTATLVVVSVEQPRHTLIQVFFEVCSAFGTTGLSLGITPELTVPGKITVIGLMFIGRIGILSLLFLLKNQPVPPVFHYPKERVIIG